MGAVIALQAGTKLAPKLAIAGQLSGATGFGADETGYVVAPNASAVFGGRWSPRENGRLNFALFALERWSGHDRKDALVYRDSGYLITDLSIAASYTFWEKALRSASFTVRAQAPLYQIVGDPMYAENFGGSLAVSVVAF